MTNDIRVPWDAEPAVAMPARPTMLARANAGLCLFGPIGHPATDAYTCHDPEHQARFGLITTEDFGWLNAMLYGEGGTG